MGGSRIMSHGRGGAGNIYSTPESQTTTPRDLVTPTIKQEVFTTGRGGSGNMMHNDPEHPELARESQDVETPPLRVEEAPHHIGRGGAANTYTPTPEEEKMIREQEEAQLRRVRTASKDRRKDLEQGSGAESGSEGPARSSTS
ncbi:conserved hypothetical protein [Aspergillus terreus NIH2624]|uniref:Uncharacterized protein n=1 Tax=Aspergillus terreus (strain NIH 2624 / FGSC A1156) TaxID=341663 RepID=Q0CN39_ASPTN|nr:uncharacterized protein ATEG_04895 [Aspergillus terreus NIH2624]EAU35342.1 conserved hypothetical protein [Aspergillus terreus NIH2624]KAG2411959.1 hypothetical protein HFD88_009515 [Aspergillus terreus]